MNTGIWGRIIVGADGATVGPRRVAVAEVFDTLSAGAPPSEILREFSLDPADLVAVAGHVVLSPGNPGPALTRERPSRPKLRPVLSGLTSLFADMGKASCLALEAGLLQIHDFWDESHAAAQEADDLGEKSVSPYWHAVAHRREPDPGNAAYWFRRVGKHPVFVPLAEAAANVMKSAADPAFGRKLIPGGAWDPYAFIEMTSRGQAPASLLREIQREEMRLLLAASIKA